MGIAHAVRPLPVYVGPFLLLPNPHGTVQRLLHASHIVSVEPLRNAAGEEIGTTVFMTNGHFFDCKPLMSDWLAAAPLKGGVA